VDGAISKTVLLPRHFDVRQLGRLLTRAHRSGVKGVTVHRFGRPRGDVILPACGSATQDGGSCDAG
jgi:ribonucleotide reductase alpha subunit